jgi:hypothetical protein
MGHLDEPGFERAIAACAGCGGTAFDIATYLDRHVPVMLADPTGDGRWVYDGEAFIDGVFRVRCAACPRVPFESPDCPRCHREGGLADGLGKETRLEVPKRCPRCKESELSLIAFVPATVRTQGPGRPPPPKPTASFGDAGFHVIAVACDACDWAIASERCPICDAAPPLRKRA